MSRDHRVTSWAWVMQFPTGATRWRQNIRKEVPLEFITALLTACSRDQQGINKGSTDLMICSSFIDHLSLSPSLSPSLLSPCLLSPCLRSFSSQVHSLLPALFLLPLLFLDTPPL